VKCTIEEHGNKVFNDCPPRFVAESKNTSIDFPSMESTAAIRSGGGTLFADENNDIEVIPPEYLT